MHSHYLAKRGNARLVKFATSVCMCGQYLKIVTVPQLRLPQRCLLRWTTPKMTARHACVAPARTAFPLWLQLRVGQTPSAMHAVSI